ncbi:cytidylyltransferase domain-containing protein [Bacillus sp. V5-8f]|uniref:acylneuraminate cytidylyltransferase family protein n=1 Tax=Bacillus sp. V5-8f TaxID=2053044 RepID=UPI000C7643A2|nr:acylneuraminate cytidylyltransferase family protein [Bacillus sp. V5-8f]PLT35484.1 CMP-N-acetylneuraminic acid synthetase [Bacillus sp. V5-8f]
MNILITICGRAGSKGVKNKNIRNFMGKPLIYYSLKIANMFREYKMKDYVTDIAVSSDSDDILNYSSAYDFVNVIKRPLELAMDDTPKVPVIKHATLTMEKLKKRKYDYVIDLDITSLLRKVNDIERALNLCVESAGKYDLVFSAVESRRNPYFNMVEIENGFANKVKDSDFACRQQAPEVFDMNASIYCFDRDSLCNKLERISFEGQSGMIQMEDTYVIDIDKEKDFEILELLVQHYYFDHFPELFTN